MDRLLERFRRKLRAVGLADDGWSIESRSLPRTGRVYYVYRHPVHGLHNCVKKAQRAMQRAQGPGPDVAPPDSPSVVIVDDDGAPEGCSICMDDVADARVRVPRCGHLFCAACLGAYLSSDGIAEFAFRDGEALPVCPTCKASGGAGNVDAGCIAMLRASGALSSDAAARLDACMVRRALPPGALKHCMRCQAVMTVDAPDDPGENPHEVRCAACGCHQCVQCQVPWHEHRGRSCAAVTAARAPVDPETRALLDGMGAFPCPGTCGNVLSKTDGCNVLRCVACRLYACALCHVKLDSSAYREDDRVHLRASEHYRVRGTPCHRALFMSREDWLRRQREAAADGPDT